MRESDIERAVVRYAEKTLGMLVLKLNGPGNRGKPDRAFFDCDRKCLVVEFKAPGKKPTALQVYWLEKFRRLGFPAFICDNIEEGRELLDKFHSGEL